VRAALNPLVATTRIAVAGRPTGNIARPRCPGRDLTEVEAYDLLVAANLAPARLTLEEQRAALVANVADGAVGGIPVAELTARPPATAPIPRLRWPAPSPHRRHR
jgi:urea transport system permease protein